MSTKREFSNDEENSDDNMEDACRVQSQGVCDCKKCLELMFRNVNILLNNGWHIVYDVSGGAGQYGFSVNRSRDLLHWIKHPQRTHSGYDDDDRVIITEEQTDVEIQKMIDKILPNIYNDRLRDETLADFGPFYHLLELYPNSSSKKTKIE